MIKKKKKKFNLKKENKLMILFTIAAIIIGITLYFVYQYNVGKPISNTKFTSIMENEGLKVFDVKNQFGEDYVESASVAFNEKANYQIEFIIFADEQSAKNAFTLNKNTFLENKNENSEEISISNEKISDYALTTEDRYMYVSRRKNTLIYLNVDGSYKTEVANLITKLGY